MTSAKSDHLTSFPVQMPFTSFPCLIALARTSSIILHNSGDSGQTCLAPDLEGKDFSFSPLSMMLFEGLTYLAFIMLRYFFFCTHLKCFDHKCML